MFSITDNKGFQITFANGWTVSVQFGPSNYCENNSIKAMIARRNSEPVNPCPDAEIAAWDKHGVWYDFKYDQVKGNCSPDDVAKFIAEISSKP